MLASAGLGARGYSSLEKNNPLLGGGSGGHVPIFVNGTDLDHHYAVTWSVALLSLIGSSILVFSFARSPQLRAPLLRPIFLIAVFDFIWASCGVISFYPALASNLTTSPPIYESSPIGCQLLAWFVEVAVAVSCTMQSCVALNMLLAFGLPGHRYKRFICCGRRTMTADVMLERVVRWELVCVPLFWVTVATVLATLGWFGPVSEEEPYECWIDMAVAPNGVIFLFYTNIVFAMLFSLGTLWWVWRVGSRRLCPKGWARTRRRLVLWVLVFTLLWVFPSIKRISDAMKADDEVSPTWLNVLHKVRVRE